MIRGSCCLRSRKLNPRGKNPPASAGGDVKYEGDYAHIGAEAARTGLVREGPLAGALLRPVAALVDLTSASAWMERHRDLSGWGVAQNMTGVREAPATAL
ncbi:hypothetical protein ACFV2U_48090 [Streptomyces sp. NPDC059697]|uniref:hypothetical protein n=1 Tax=Streptomyces sp. NPDC059697 TaxID=3346912 RepID=UPI0036CBAEC7